MSAESGGRRVAAPRASGGQGEHTDAPSGQRWTRFYQQTPAYFRRLYEQAVREWRKPPPALESFPRSGLVLDIGSGAGLLCALLAGRGAVAVGLDVSIEGARAGRSLARRHGLGGCLFVVGDAQALPFRGSAFAAAGHYAILEHLSDPTASLREVGRVLTPGGRLVLLTVNALYPPRWRPALARVLLAVACAPAEREIEALRRRGFEGPDVESWRAGCCLDTWRIPAPLLRRLLRALMVEERYETFHLGREGRQWLDESLRLTLERPAWPVRAARRAYLWLNRLPVVRHLGPVVLWIGRKPVEVGEERQLRLDRASIRPGAS